MHPYEIAQTLRERAKDENIRLNYGSLYGVVEGLAKRGLIEAMETLREGRRPERTVYRVTSAGRREAIDWLTELIAVPRKEYLAFEASLALIGALSPDEAVRALKQRQQRLEIDTRQLRTTLEAMAESGLVRLFAIEGEYVLGQLEAELAFVRGIVADIESGALGGLEEWEQYSSGETAFSGLEPQPSEPARPPAPAKRKGKAV